MDVTCRTAGQQAGKSVSGRSDRKPEKGCTEPTKIGEVAKEHRIAYVAEGSNLDDNGDYRPGLQAVAELDVKSPLRYAGMTKETGRHLRKNN